MIKLKTKDIFISNNSIVYDMIQNYELPFEILPNIKNIILKLGQSLDSDYVKQKENVWIHKSANVSSNVEIIGPCIIDAGAEIRHNAYIRENVIIGKNCVVGNSCEIKNSILYDNVQVPHFNYVGDSVMGYGSHLGAGAIVSNLKNNKSNIVLNCNGEIIDTNLRKVGAFIGDNVQVGCGCVLNPGTIILPNTDIYPLTNVRGIVEKDSIVKDMNNIIEKNKDKHDGKI